MSWNLPVTLLEHVMDLIETLSKIQWPNLLSLISDKSLLGKGIVEFTSLPTNPIFPSHFFSYFLPPPTCDVSQSPSLSNTILSTTSSSCQFLRSTTTFLQTESYILPGHYNFLGIRFHRLPLTLTWCTSPDIELSSAKHTRQKQKLPSPSLQLLSCRHHRYSRFIFNKAFLFLEIVSWTVC